MMAKNLTIFLTVLSVTCTSAFISPGASQRCVVPTSSASPSPSLPTQLFASETAASDVDDNPKMNPDNPALPALKGDYDWDAEYAADDDWITTNVPGKIVVNEIELAAQVTELSKIEEKYRAIRKAKEYEDARIIGWVPQAEMYNGRYAMFFLAVGLLTEYWTGISIPGQIEEMARVGGFIGPEF
ncbi:hypothetical protein ACHAXH_006039 [Discostella pseudostelligera]